MSTRLRFEKRKMEGDSENEINRLRRDNKVMTSQIQQLGDRITRAEADRSNAVEERDVLREKLRSVEATIPTIKKDHQANVTNMIAKHTNELNTVKRDYQTRYDTRDIELTRKINDLQKILETTKSKLGDKARMDIDDLETKRRNIRKEYETQIRNLEQKHEAATDQQRRDLEKRIDVLTIKNRDLANEKESEIARRAKEIAQLKRGYDDEISYARDENTSMDRRYTLEISRLKDQIRGLEKDLADKDRIIHETRQELKDSSSRIRDVQTTLESDLASRRYKNEEAEGARRTKIKEIDTERTVLRNKADKLQKELNDAKKAKDDAEARARNLNERVKKLEIENRNNSSIKDEELENLKKTGDINLRNTVNEYKVRIQDLERKAAGEKKDYQTELQSLQKALKGDAQSAITDLELRLKTKEKEHADALKKQMNEYERIIQTTKREYDGRINELMRDLKDSKARAEDERQKTATNIERMTIDHKQKISSLEDQIENYRNLRDGDTKDHKETLRIRNKEYNDTVDQNNDLRNRINELQRNLKKQKDDNDEEQNRLKRTYERKIEDLTRELNKTKQETKLLQTGSADKELKAGLQNEKRLQELENQRLMSVKESEGFQKKLRDEIQRLTRELGLRDIRIDDMQKQLELSQRRLTEVGDENEKSSYRMKNDSVKITRELKDRIDDQTRKIKQLAAENTRLEADKRQAEGLHRETKDDLDSAREKAKAASVEASNTIEDLRRQIADMLHTHSVETTNLKNEHTMRLKTIEEENAGRRKDLEYEINTLRRSGKNTEAKSFDDYKKRINDMRNDYEQRIKTLTNQYEETIRTQTKDSAARIKDGEKQYNSEREQREEDRRIADKLVTRIRRENEDAMNDLKNELDKTRRVLASERLNFTERVKKQNETVDRANKTINELNNRIKTANSQMQEMHEGHQDNLNKLRSQADKNVKNLSSNVVSRDQNYKNLQSRLEQEKLEHERTRAELRQAREDHASTDAKLRTQREANALLKTTHEAKMQNIRQQYDAQIKALTDEFNIRMKREREESEGTIRDLRNQLKAVTAQLKGDSKSAVADLEEQLRTTRKEYEKRIRTLDLEYQRNITNTTKEYDRKIHVLEVEVQRVRKELADQVLAAEKAKALSDVEHKERVNDLERQLEEQSRAHDRAMADHLNQIKTLSREVTEKMETIRKMERDTKEVNRSRLLDRDTRDEEVNQLKKGHQQEVIDLRRRLGEADKENKILRARHDAQVNQLIGQSKDERAELEAGMRHSVMAGKNFQQKLREAIAVLEEDVKLKNVKIQDLTDRNDNLARRLAQTEEESEAERYRLKRDSTARTREDADRVRELDHENRNQKSTIQRLEERATRSTKERDEALNKVSDLERKLRSQNDNSSNALADSRTHGASQKAEYEAALKTIKVEHRVRLDTLGEEHKGEVADLRRELKSLRQALKGEASEAITDLETRINEIRKESKDSLKNQEREYENLIENHTKDYKLRIRALEADLKNLREQAAKDKVIHEKERARISREAQEKENELTTYQKNEAVKFNLEKNTLEDRARNAAKDLEREEERHRKTQEKLRRLQDQLLENETSYTEDKSTRNYASDRASKELADRIRDLEQQLRNSNVAREKVQDALDDRTKNLRDAEDTIKRLMAELKGSKDNHSKKTTDAEENTLRLRNDYEAQIRTLKKEKVPTAWPLV
eukprot:TRINITY_DN62_c0_g2_i2.p1 TRINITY_DN62_c0_g2~~TRINITY_DN62_c0_g2_i2.p1  ORF type:complete len:1946 (+),score=549.89 TRINITY_DN62_c0_g2_i2:759-5840(+)